MQHIIADTLDDLLRSVFQKLLRDGQAVTASKGPNKELTGVVLELKNPLARLSRTETKGTVFSCLGETLWYLARSNDLKFIKYYLRLYGKFAERNGTVHGAYGPRMFKMRGNINQINNIIKLLRKKPSSRQAVVQLFNAEDLIRLYKDTPCTCTMQYFIRKGALHKVVHMRSNDAFLGLPHDIFAFTFIQELVARTLGLKLGSYKHLVGSLHVYDSDRDKVRKFLKEAYQSRTLMPAMPAGDPWPNLRKLLKVEDNIRCGMSCTRFC
jgi:thymidylate synthase